MLLDDLLQLSPDFSDSFYTKSPITGLTHNLYQYPARFSPHFARTVINNFSEPGEVILDPFMGSGTTLIEAMVAGRKCLGTDISPLATLIAKTKTTIYSERELRRIEHWWYAIKESLSIYNSTSTDSFWATNGYHRNVPWRIRKMVELILDAATSEFRGKTNNFLRCVLLSTAKAALEDHELYVKSAEFILLFESTLLSTIKQFRDLQIAVESQNAKNVSALMLDAKALKKEHFTKIGAQKANLIITSPPYPGVHILYHRWQIDGSKETPAPFWIAGSPDGQGEAFYTLGGRSRKGVDNYFLNIEEIYAHLRNFLSQNALVFQMVAFSNIIEQLPLFNKAMEKAGFREISVHLEKKDHIHEKYMTRRVPLRKWYADFKGKTDSSLEFLLVHKKL